MLLAFIEDQKDICRRQFKCEILNDESKLADGFDPRSIRTTYLHRGKKIDQIW